MAVGDGTIPLPARPGVLIQGKGPAIGPPIGPPPTVDGKSWENWAASGVIGPLIGYPHPVSEAARARRRNMANSRIAFLTGCAVTGSVAFAVAKGWIALGAPGPELAQLPNFLGGGETERLDAPQLPPPPPPAESIAPMQMPPSAIEKLETQLRGQTEKNREAIAQIQDDLKQQRQDIDKLKERLSGQDNTLASMALDDKLARIVEDRGPQQAQPPWFQGLLWAAGGMVLTVSSIVMAGVFASTARDRRLQGGHSAAYPPVYPPNYPPIRVVPTYLPGRTPPEFATQRRSPNGHGDYIDYDY